MNCIIIYYDIYQDIYFISLNSFYVKQLTPQLTLINNQCKKTTDKSHENSK